MSPLSLRRYRAERLLREEFELQRARVLTRVRARLRAAGVHLDDGDLQDCYASAWHGLYASLLEGRPIANPTGWLVVACHRRALDEHRARRRTTPGEEPLAPAPEGRDLAEELDDRTRLRHLFEALRSSLGARERQAAALCYVQGLSRADAARAMGVSERGMRKLMEGPGDGRPGVAGKLGALVQTIREGAWCEEQGSLMRGFAFGVLDQDGERYRLATDHLGGCPACRAYVASLRGLAALLPPPLAPLLSWARSAGPGPGLAPSHGAGAPHAGISAGPAGALPASAGACTGAGAAGGGWLFAGGPAAKLAVGCALALGLGAECVSLTSPPQRPRHTGRPHAARARMASPRALALRALPTSSAARLPVAPPQAASVAGAATTAHLSAPAAARREFGPEQALGGGAATAAHVGAASSRSPLPLAVAASAKSTSRAPGGEFAAATPAAGSSAGTGAANSPQGSAAGGAGAAQREFAPG